MPLLHNKIIIPTREKPILRVLLNKAKHDRSKGFKSVRRKSISDLADQSSMKRVGYRISLPTLYARSRHINLSGLHRILCSSRPNERQVQRGERE